MYNIFLLFITGAIAGLMAGLLGIGGASIMVPLYLYYFKIENIYPLENQFHMAVGCSLAVILVSSVIASINNYRFKLIDYTLAKRFLPCLLLGILIGTGISNHINGVILKKSFSIFLMLIIIQMLMDNKKKIKPKKNISLGLFYFVATLVGILNTLFGLAGGTIMVPYFISLGLDTQKAVATSIFLAIPISIIANLSLNLTSSYFLINWQVVIPTAIISAIFTPIGSKIGRNLSSHWLKNIFAAFLLFVSIDMLLF